TPFTHKSPDKNIAVFPKDEYAIPTCKPKSATEVVSEVFANHTTSPNLTAK
ncbi:unnamed protein product, partial [Allacma fusca]